MLLKLKMLRRAGPVTLLQPSSGNTMESAMLHISAHGSETRVQSLGLAQITSKVMSSYAVNAKTMRRAGPMASTPTLFWKHHQVSDSAYQCLRFRVQTLKSRAKELGFETCTLHRQCELPPCSECQECSIPVLPGAYDHTCDLY